MQDLTVVIPIYEENHEIVERTTRAIQDLGAEVIVVDDGSRHPYKKSIKHGQNTGYGAAVLTGVKNSTRDIIMSIDGDGQHCVEEVERLYKAWKLMDCDMLVGVRRLEYESTIRFIGRKILNTIASFLAVKWLPDLNSGMRIFKREIVEGYAPILCPWFSFTTSLTMSMLCDGYRVEWFPIKVMSRKYGASRVRLFKHGLVTLYYMKDKRKK